MFLQISFPRFPSTSYQGSCSVTSPKEALRGEAISLVAESRSEMAGTMLFNKRLHAADNLVHVVRLDVEFRRNFLCRHVVLLAANVDFKVPARNVLFRLQRLKRTHKGAPDDLAIKRLALVSAHKRAFEGLCGALTVFRVNFGPAAEMRKAGAGLPIKGSYKNLTRIRSSCKTSSCFRYWEARSFGDLEKTSKISETPRLLFSQ